MGTYYIIVDVKIKLYSKSNKFSVHIVNVTT